MINPTLKTNGVTIINNVLDEKECDDMKDGMWNYISHITQKWDKPITKDDPTSWSGYKNLFLKHSMLLQHFEIGQAQFIWNVRQNPKIVNIYSSLYECKNEDLLVSFDGASFHLPHEVTKTGYFRNLWFHCDQSFTRNNFECVQSWVNAYDTNEGDATLAYLDGSHLYHKKFAEEFKKNDKDDWYKLNQEEYEWYIAQGCEEKRVVCPKGSLVMWDSRVIHCGVEPNKIRSAPNFRCCVYVCYQPRKNASAAMIKKKQKAFYENRTTNHWPCKPKLFPKTPRTYGAELKEITSIYDEGQHAVLSELGKKLVGF